METDGPDVFTYPSINLQYQHVILLTKEKEKKVCPK